MIARSHLGGVVNLLPSAYTVVCIVQCFVWTLDLA